jgi:hypothetical protein
MPKTFPLIYGQGARPLEEEDVRDAIDTGDKVFHAITPGNRTL